MLLSNQSFDNPNTFSPTIHNLHLINHNVKFLYLLLHLLSPTYDLEKQSLFSLTYTVCLR